MEKTINKTTLDKIIKRHETKRSYYNVKYSAYSFDDYYYALVNTKNKNYYFIKNGYKNYDYRLLFVADKYKRGQTWE